MNKKLSLKYLVVASVIVGVELLYISDFFTPEEKVPLEAKAYIDGATPPATQDWEIF